MKLKHMFKKLSMEAKELKELVEELKIDIVKKETRLDHLQRTNDEFSITKEEIIVEFKASSTFSKITDEHYVAGFKDFHQDAEDYFVGVDFSPIKLCIASEDSILVNGSDDVYVEHVATTIDNVVPRSETPIVNNDEAQQFYFSFLLFYFILFNRSCKQFIGSIVLDHVNSI